MTSFQEMTFSELLSDAEVFVDGDWVESKDQDPNGDVRLIQLADIGDGFYIDKSSRFLNSETAKRLKCTYLKEGDILVARMPDPLGRACIFPKSEMPCVTVVDVCIIRPNQNKVDNRWLMHTINSPVMRQRINEYVTGTTRQRISRGNFSKLKVSVPPLAEQRRIASILDQADELRQKRQQAIEKLDQLLQATFIDMFGDPISNPKGFEVKKLSEQVDLIQIGPFGTQLHQEDYIENGIPLINPSHIKNGKIIPNHKLTVSQSKYEELTQYHLRLNDVLLGRRGEMGRCAVVTQNEVGWLCGTGSLFLRPNLEKINPFFLELLLSSDSIKRYLENVSQGQTMANLNKTIVGSIPLISPSIEIQNKFFLIAEKIDKMKTELKSTKNQVNNLFESLQNQAFNGTL
ncbi:restriction endonuclease subunit S [Acinetobacter ursingii]|uniref:restriction endonuclease subunit S n=1 Tax=Acinetobacter ursingii TaxID=108980 RepID=UPI001D18BBA2|nr:restriction endonuclease subunit S [Acinetobacter ursingii]